MLTPQTKQLTYATALVDAVALGASFALAYALRSIYTFPFLGSTAPPVLASHVWMITLAVPVFWLLASQTGLYSHPTQVALRTLVWDTFRTQLYLGMLLGTAIFLFQAQTFSRTVLIVFLGVGFALVVIGRLLLRSIRGRRAPQPDSRRRLLIVGTSGDALQVGRRLRENQAFPVEVLGHLLAPHEEAGHVGAQATLLGTIDDLKRIVEEEIVDEVVFAAPLQHLSGVRQAISWCEEVGVTVHLKVDFVRTLLAKTYPTEWDGIPMLTISTTPQDAVGLLFKRMLDIGVSTVGLVVLAPLLILCGAAVRLTSRGPALFVQNRVGLNGRQFELYKFRSMYRDAEQRRKELEPLNEMSGPVFKVARDPRVTPLGRWLRKFSLDELPQLWNVLRGDMSLVGPRPPIPQEVREYERWQIRRLSMKPGLTCLWQIRGRNRVGFDEWMKLDLAYIDNWSLKLDFMILLRTVPAVLLTRGAR